MTQSAESFVSFKKYRNLVNRKLKEAQNQFSEDFLRKLKPRKRNGNSFKKLEGKTTIQTSLKLMKMVKKTKDKKSICNAFNRVFSKMGIYRWQIVPFNVEKIERKFQEFNFRPFTLREIYKVIDDLDNNKAPGPGYINACALKSGKYAIGIHLQIIFNDCI